MGNVLFVAENKRHIAVMLPDHHRFVFEKGISEEESENRMSRAVILVFVPKEIYDSWDEGDPRRLGIAGTIEDWSGIENRHEIIKEDFYVPFLGGHNVDVIDLARHGATLNRFNEVLAVDDWTIKFGKKPDWVSPVDAKRDLAEH